MSVVYRFQPLLSDHRDRNPDDPVFEFDISNKREPIQLILVVEQIVRRVERLQIGESILVRGAGPADSIFDCLLTLLEVQIEEEVQAWIRSGELFEVLISKG